MKLRRPAMRYHGGKWKLAPWIIGHFPRHHVYVEPFGGAASVLLRKPRSYAEVYNDLDGEIVNFFRVLRDRQQSAELQRLCELTPYSRAEFDLSYQPADDPIEQARRTVFRSFAGHGSGAASGYNTGFRANPTRSHTTPADDWKGWPSNINRLSKRLRGVIFENMDALEAIERHNRPITFIYCDPPYVAETRSTTTSDGKNQVYRYEMDSIDHENLLHTLRQSDAMIALSGYRCELYDDMLHDWQRVEIVTHGDGRSKRTEVLWLNRQCVDNQRQRRLL